MMSDLFSSLPLPAEQLANLEQLGYATMTPIQAASLPVMLSGGDLIAKAQTGSGKTAAFGLGLLARLNPRYFGTQALVLCPTRELADQVAKEIRRLARFADNIKVLTLCGGSPIGPQRASLEHGAQVLVGTPGRIIDHLDRGTLKLDALKTLVLDEADRMVDMGFYDEMVRINDACPRPRQTLLFSATYPDTIRKQSARFLKNPAEVSVDALHGDERIAQTFYEVDAEGRADAVVKLLRHHRPTSAIAFCNTKARCRELVDALSAKGIAALALSGELEQRERDEVLVRFSNKSCTLLVATDVAARGLDVAGLDLVINVDITPDPEIHVHRIGRTGRAGESGRAVSLSTPFDARRAAAIEEYLGRPLSWASLADLPKPDPTPLTPAMVTLQILGGRKDKVRPGDILGALTGDKGLPGSAVGKIALFDRVSYVAVERKVAAQAQKRLAEGGIKGKAAKVRQIGD
ncbi:ATP-dependent RNA helicase DbpA [Crenobacter cavernae]|uniref:ATP-dependent RNA helicase DbpA n=2 Tax=Crenobacter cavernae TaxID=2290923 RepID=A0ABY0FCW3_9NEIS|nr:ATP-dependent RNA helicase DbpA [Crenobacter cavernae]